MSDVEVSTRIEASPDRVWELVGDPTRMGEWSPECRRVEWVGSATAPAVRARFRGHNRRGWRSWTTTGTIVGYEPGREIAWDVGSAGFATHYRPRSDGALALDAPDGRGPAAPMKRLPVDLAANAESLGARVVRAGTLAEIREGLAAAREACAGGPIVIHVEADRYATVPGFDSWWDVPVAEISEQTTVRAAREQYERDASAQRQFV